MRNSQEIPYLLRNSKVSTGPKGSENGWQNPKRLAVRLAEIGWRRSCRSASPERCQPAKPGTGIARRTHTLRSTTLPSRSSAGVQTQLGDPLKDQVAACVYEFGNEREGVATVLRVVLRSKLVVRHVTIFGHGHGLQRAIIDESQHRTPERLVMAQH